MRLTLTRIASDDQGTIGTLTLRGQVIALIGELPWRDNAPELSRIPPGTYRADYLDRSASGKYREAYHLRDVPGRSAILIHAGNWHGDSSKGYRTDTYGCLLPGLRLGRLNGQRAVLASRGGLDALHSATGRQSFDLTIQDLAA